MSNSVYQVDDHNNIIKDEYGNDIKILKHINSGHYVTVTEIIMDKGKRWLKVQTWGKYYYINYEEMVLGKGPDILNGIVYIKDKGE